MSDRMDEMSTAVLRVAARNAFMAGEQLLVGGTIEALSSALRRYQEALGLWRIVVERQETGKEFEHCETFETFNLVLTQAAADKTSASETLFKIGYVYKQLGEPQTALQYFEQAINIYQELGDWNGIATLLYGIGDAYNDTGEREKALDCFRKSLIVSEKVGLRRFEALSLNRIGLIYSEQGQAQQALDHLEQACSVARQIKDGGIEAAALYNIGQTYEQSGQMPDALNYLKQSLDTYHALGDYANEASGLNSIAEAYLQMAEGEKARPYLNKALHLYQLLDDPDGQALALCNRALTHISLDEYAEADSDLKAALPLSEASGNPTVKARMFSALGEFHEAKGEIEKALGYYLQALSLIRELREANSKALCLSKIGSVYTSLRENQEAHDYLEQALNLSREINNRSVEAQTLAHLGRLYESLDEWQQAREYFMQALPLSGLVNDRMCEAGILAGLGRVLMNAGEKPEALTYLKQALALRRAAKDRSSVAALLHDIGTIYSELGENQRSFEHLQQALSIEREIGNRGGESNVLNSLGSLYWGQGQWEKALNLLTQALELAQERGNQLFEANTLNSLGMLYASVDETSHAFTYFGRALTMRRDLLDRDGVTVTLCNIGLVFHSLRDGQAALDYFEQALEVCRRAGNRNLEGIVFNYLGLAHLLLGDEQKARDHFEESITLNHVTGNQVREGAALHNLGISYLRAGEHEKALDYLNRSLQICRVVDYDDGEAKTLLRLAEIQKECGQLNKAQELITKAIGIVETMRVKILSPDLRASFFASNQSYYEFYIDLLMQLHELDPAAGHDSAALQVSERSRARSLLEILTEARVNVREGCDPSLLEREQHLKRQLADKDRDRIRMLSGKPTLAQLAEAEKEINDLLRQLQHVETEIRLHSSHDDELAQAEPLSLREIQGLLDPDTLLLEYSLGTERSFLWAVSSDGPLTSYELPPRAEIEEAARSFYQLLTARGIPAEPGETKEQWWKRIREAAKEADERLPQAAYRLSRAVLSPLAAQLGARRLLIVSDGALQYVPFAALTEPSAKTSDIDEDNQYLVFKHEIIYLPSASTLSVLRHEARRRIAPTKKCAVFADPVFRRDDDRVKKSKEDEKRETEPMQEDAPVLPTFRDVNEGAFVRSAAEAGLASDRGFNSLPYTKDEAEEILSIMGREETLVALGFEASRTKVLSADLSVYPILHFAGHGLVNSLHPELSGVVMSLFDEEGRPQDGFLRLYDIYNMRLAAELVVLSACQTALGREVKGEGLIGLTRGFMYAGAARVVASLWEVNDEATAELMKLFYQGIERGERYTAALREAQLKWLERYQEGREKRSPYYWAAFTIQGEWL